MKIKKQLRKILEEDERYLLVKDFSIIRKYKDINHLERRQQTRAIPDEAICIALLYGKMKWVRSEPSYFLLDRSLIGTPYEKYIDTLRGLKVVCWRVDDHLEVRTALWYDKYRKRRTNISSCNRPRKRGGRKPPPIKPAEGESFRTLPYATERQRDRRARTA